MKKKYILVAMMAAAVGLAACSFERKEEDADAGTTIGSQINPTENAEIKPSNTDDIDAVSTNADLANKKPTDTYAVDTDPMNPTNKESDDAPPAATESPAANVAENNEKTDLDQAAASLVAYRQVVEGSESGMVFSLIYLDKDENPELVAGDRGNGRYSIYTIKDGAVFSLVDSMTVAELTYFEHSGIIAAFASWNGGGDEGGYGWQYYQTSADKTLTNGDTPFLEYSYNAVYDDEGVYTGKGITVYFHMGQETDEAGYKELMETLGIKKDSGRTCLEGAVIAEEMLGNLK